MATIRDVARQAGVGVGTASRVISGRGPASKDAIARVNAAVAELGFRPSEIARALSSMSAGLVGVYVPDFHGAFFGPFLQTISDQLRACHRRMVVANGFGDDDNRTQALNGIEFLIDRECDGIIVFSNQLHDEDILAFSKRQPRIAVINRLVAGLEENCFYVDHQAGGALAARTLLSNGHRRIAVIAGPEIADDNRLRLEGFFAELETHGIKRKDVATAAGNFSFEGGWQAMRELFERSRDFTGLFCANDEMAMSAISFLQEQGLRIPQDISVVGYDASVMSGYTAPRLTTVAIPMREMAANGCRWLLNQCFSLNLEVERQFTIDTVWRNSVAAVSDTA